METNSWEGKDKMSDDDDFFVDNRTVFSNLQVNPSNIDTLATLEYSRLQPAYRTVSVISTIVFGTIVAGIATLIWNFTEENSFDILKYVYSGIAIVTALITILVVAGYRKKSYALRERDVIYNQGLIWHSSTVIPFNRVQHCEISQGPIERWFDLAELKVFTAGGASSDMSIPGLDLETANRLKEYIVIKTGLNDEEE